MPVFTTLLLGHLVADFPLQTNRLFQLKAKTIWGLLAHVAVHVGLTALLLQAPLRDWGVLLFLGSTHLAIDWIKLRWPTTRQAPSFLVDQVAHVVVLGLITLARPDLAVVTLPGWLLGLGLLGVFVTAALMFLWVLANDLRETVPAGSPRVEWAQQSMFVMSQRIGRVVVASLVLAWIMVIL